MKGDTMISLLKNPIKMVRENLGNIGRTVEMSIKELNKKYSGTFLGVVWSLVKPMLFISVYWFAIEVGIRGGGKEHSGYPFILWLISGIIPWFYISETLVYGGTSFRQNKHLITKMVYPKSTIPTFRMLSQLYIHIVMTIIIVLIFTLSGHPPDIYYLQIPYYLFTIFVFMTVLSWATASLVVVSRDFEHLLKSINQMIFWLTPIFWSLDNVKGPLKYIIMANPFYYFIKGYRDIFINKKWFYENMNYTLYFWLITLFLSIIGGYIYSKLKDEFADIL